MEEWPMRAVILCVIPPLFLAGCAFTQHEITVESSVPVALNPIEKKTAVSITIRDERDSDNVGKRVGGFGAKITAPDLMAKIDGAIREVFTRKGYRVVSDNATPDAQIDVGVRSFSFDVETGWVTGGEHVSVVLIVEARKYGQAYKKVYRASDEERVFFVAFGSELDDKMSRAFNNVLAQIAQDAELEHFLVETSPSQSYFDHQQEGSSPVAFKASGAW